MDLVHARGLAERNGGQVVVAGQHGDVTDSEESELADHGASFGAQFVADGDGAQEPATPLDEHDGAACALERIDGGAEIAGGDGAGLAQPGGPALDGPVRPLPVTACTSSAAGTSGAARMAAASGCSLWVSSAAATRSTVSRSPPSATTTSTTVGRMQFEGAGLVEGDDSDTGEALQGGAPLTSAPTRRGADGGDDGDRDRDRERAAPAATRTTSERPIHSRGSPPMLPATATAAAATMMAGTSGRRCARPAAGSPLALLRLLDDVDDAGQRAVGGAGGDVDLEHAAAVDRRREHLGVGSTSVGMDSPVIADRSRVDRPRPTMPSVARRPPGPTTMPLPTASSVG